MIAIENGIIIFHPHSLLMRCSVGMQDSQSSAEWTRLHLCSVWCCTARRKGRE